MWRPQVERVHLMSNVSLDGLLQVVLIRERNPLLKGEGPLKELARCEHCWHF